MKRLKYAYHGMIQMFRKDSHFFIHLVITIAVIFLSFVFPLSIVEWLFVMSAIFSVLSTEAINTSIEYVVDLVTEDYHELAKFAKDISAFAVLLTSLYAVMVGLIIFMPKIISLL